MAKAKALGEIALERGLSAPPEANELETLVRRSER
jgi:hypothetical protein